MDTIIQNGISCSPLCEIILKVMCLGISEHEKELVELYRPFICQVDQFINYYQSAETSSDLRAPIFYSLEANDEMRRVLSRYLTVRLGILNAKSVRDIKKECSREYEPKVDKKYKRSFKYTNLKNRIANNYGDALWYFKRDIKTLLDFYSDKFEESSYNVMICGNQEVLDGRDSLLGEFIEQRYNREKSLYVNASLDASGLTDSADAYYNNEQEKYSGCSEEFLQEYLKPVDGNVYMIYYNSSRFRSFSKGDISRLGFSGFNCKNFFVFVLIDKYYTTGRLLAGKQSTEQFLNTSEEESIFYCIQPDNLPVVNPRYIPSNYFRYQSDKDEDVAERLRSAVSIMLSDCSYLLTKKNVLSVCCGKQSALAFCRTIIKEKCKEDLSEEVLTCHASALYAQYSVVFDYIRNQWEIEFRDKIKRFVAEGEKQIAFVISSLAPILEVKADLQSLFPEYELSFYVPAGLRPGDDYAIKKERYIVVIRYYRYYEDGNSSYPNSYDPYKLLPGQKLLEIINTPLFQNVIDTSNYLLTRTYNTLSGSSYQKRVLGWSPKHVKRPSANWESNSRADYDSAEYTKKVKVVFADGKTRLMQESLLCIAQFNSLSTFSYVTLATLMDSYENYEKIFIQPINEIEDVIRPRAEEEMIREDLAERHIRERYIPLLGPIAMDFQYELWRLLLENRVKEQGSQVVYDAIIVKRGYTRRFETFKKWYNQSEEMILPSDYNHAGAVMEYLGLISDNPMEDYLTIEKIKKRHRRKANEEQNNNFDRIISIVLNSQSSLINYQNSIKDDEIETLLRLVGVRSEEDFAELSNEIISSINLKEIKQIQPDGN